MAHTQKNMNNLIICMTPLQTLIAHKIIDFFSEESFDVVYVSLKKSAKDYYYYDLIKDFGKKCYFIKEPDSFLGILNFRYFIDRLRVDYNKIFIANIERVFIHLLISRLSFKEIHTFDDGVANIITSSIFYSKTSKNPLKNIVWRVVGVKYDMLYIKEQSKLHYTLYKNVPNIIENTKYISLLPQIKSDCSGENKVVKFYLGQPLTEIDEKFNHNFVESKLERLKVDYYYPHPREESYPNGEFKIIESPLIFEDYILKFLLENSNVKVEVYSFFSTALLNLVDIRNIDLMYIFDESLYDLHKDFYDLAESLFNIPYLNLE